VVYLAETTGADRVAIKLLQTAMADAGDERDRFAREAAAAKQVARFCTAQVIDADIEGDRPYIVSEYVPGPSLQSLVTERGPLEGGALDRLAIGTATALVAIHQAGVVHRDLKPLNVLIGPDGPRVIDFGIARMMGHAATLTGQTLGTPAYMAPEQVRGGEITPAADVFAWGATLVFAASGTPPFGRDSIAVLAHRIVHEPPELGALTGSLRDLVAECLDKDPARRPSAGVLLMRLLGHPSVPGGEQAATAILAEGVTAAALPPVSAGPPTQPATPSPPTRVEIARQAERKRRHSAQALAGTATALALAGAAVLAAVAFRDRGGSPLPGPTVTVSARVTTTSARQAPPPQTGASSSRPGRPASQPGFTVQPGACDLGDAGLSCAVTLRGTGAAFSWSATAADPLSLSSSSGSLNPGETVTVTITLSPASPRVAGAGTATFTGAGHARTVRVTWDDAPDPGPSSS
jgi:serine/threonine protein kinase